MWRWAWLLLISGSLGKERIAVVSLATNDYYAKGAFVTLHSAGIHSGGGGADRLLLVPSTNQLSTTWRHRFEALQIKVVDVPDVPPSPAFLAAMTAERKTLEGQGVLEILQPMPYGGAFAKVHAWNPALGYEKVLLLDGDILIKRSLKPLLRLDPLSAGKDLNDAFNYGVVVLKPNATIHAALVDLLMHATDDDLKRYNTRKPSDVGLCDQTLVAGFFAQLTSHPLHFFEDLAAGRPTLMSSEFNLVVSYRAKALLVAGGALSQIPRRQDRCESPHERKGIDKARILHFANHWLNFEALIENREAPGRVDSPRCYKGAFRHWHDVYHHGLQVSEFPEQAVVAPRYEGRLASQDGMATPEEVKDMFLSFQAIKANFLEGHSSKENEL